MSNETTTAHHNVPGDCWYCHGGCSVCTPEPATLSRCSTCGYPFDSRDCDCDNDRYDECDRCESTGRITVVVTDDDGGYDGSAPCPDCR
jgi:hypothetical protein